MSDRAAGGQGRGHGPASRWAGPLGHAARIVMVLAGLLIVVQSLIVVQARPQDLVTGIHGMADILRRAMPPDFAKFDAELWPALEPIDIAIVGTIAGVTMALKNREVRRVSINGTQRPCFRGMTLAAQYVWRLEG